MRVIIALAGALGLAACTTTPPQRHDVLSETTVQHPPAETWRRLADFAHSRGMMIAIENEQAGLLQVTLTSEMIDRYADCGYTHSGTLPDPQGTVTVELRPVDAGTKVNVRLAATDRMWLASNNEITRAPCTSRGILEQEVFAAVR